MQDLAGPESTQIKGRIDTAGDAEQGTDKERGKDAHRTVQHIHRQRSIDGPINKWQGRLKQADGNDQRDQRQADGLTEKLGHQLHLTGPGQLPEANFTGAANGPGGGQVNEVNAGDDQDQNAKEA